MFPSQPFLYITILRVNMYGLEIYLNLWGDTKVHYIETACHAKKMQVFSFIHSFSIQFCVSSSPTKRVALILPRKFELLRNILNIFLIFFYFSLNEIKLLYSVSKVISTSGFFLYAWSTLELWVHGKLIFVNFVVCPPLPRNTCNRMKFKKIAFYNYVLIKYIVFIS